MELTLIKRTEQNTIENERSRIQELLRNNNFNWNNGRWYRREIEIRLFCTKESDKECGQLWIGDQLIKRGYELQAISFQEGEVKLAKWLFEQVLNIKL